VGAITLLLLLLLLLPLLLLLSLCAAGLVAIEYINTQWRSVVRAVHSAVAT
jgi:hypothetical protein